MSRLALVPLLALFGCGSCQKEAPSELRVEGEQPFVRCMAREEEPRDLEEATIGALTLRRDERVLVISGASTVRLVALSGSVAFGAPDPVRFALVSATQPTMIVVLGVAPSASEIAPFLTSLAAVGPPVLLVPGGTDELVALGDALDAVASPQLIDGSGLDLVKLGDAELVLASGAPRGRYAVNARACGFLDDDLDALATRLGQGGASRWLVSWAAPGGGVAMGIDGADAGDAHLRTFMARVGAIGGLYAFPYGAGLRREANDLVAPSFGATLDRFDGSSTGPGFVVVELATGGLRVVSSEGGTPSAVPARPPAIEPTSPN